MSHAKDAKGASDATSVGLRVRNVTRAFGPIRALDGLSFSVRPGEFVAIVGRSGSGKSTLLRLIAGLDRPDAGAIELDDASVAGVDPRVRVMFQDGRLLPWLSVHDNVALGLLEHARPRATELLRRVGLAERARDWPAKLSGGQRQRVALARALAARPALLLLDEPLGSLDALTRLEMQSLLERLWLERGFTALLITHDVEEAVALADRVLLLERGRIAETWEAAFDRPRPRGSLPVAALADAILRRLLEASDD